MEPFIAQIRVFAGPATPAADSDHDKWVIIHSMSSPIYRSIPEG